MGKHLLKTENMHLTVHICTLGLYLSVYISMVHSSQITEKELSFVNEVLRDLPTAECDMIVVSTTPFHGEISMHVTNNLEYAIWSMKIFF